jgi:protein-tyrosine-phosphatase/DNA-binding HxlR family transcriptional regulator
MTTDQISELEARASVHRALGDPGRLALVDALMLGDVSPSRLQRELGMSSNLLAHHVAVLAAAGMVRRVRSEGDRRRSYLTLVPGSLDELRTSRVLDTNRVVFVCTENVARSPLAAALWARYSDVPATSAGTHPAPRVHPGALAAARRHHMNLAPTPPSRLGDVLRAEDQVITVCDRAHESLTAVSTHTHWSIPDPARVGTDDAFDGALRELTDRISRLAPAVAPHPTDVTPTLRRSP